MTPFSDVPDSGGPLTFDRSKIKGQGVEHRDGTNES